MLREDWKLGTAHTGFEVIRQVFGGFRVIEHATPRWLTDPATGDRLMVDRFYPELGVVIRFVDSQEAGTDDRFLMALCRQKSVALIRFDPRKRTSEYTLVEMRTALSAVARRVAQWQGTPEIKLDVISRVATAKKSCDQLIHELIKAPLPLPDITAELGLETRGRRWQRRLHANWRQFRQSWRAFAENRLAILGLVMILLFGLMSLLHPVLRATVWKQGYYDPITGYDMEVMHPAMPSSRHLLGTDSLGRDVLSMLLAATTPTFTVGIAAAVSTALISTTFGVLSAYYRRAVDTVLIHISDAFLLLPAPLFMVIIGMQFRDIKAVVLGLIYGFIAGAGGAAIVMRSHALTIMNRPFIEAARIAGGGAKHIILRHLLPHMLPLSALYMMLSVTGAVVADGFISF